MKEQLKTCIKALMAVVLMSLVCVMSSCGDDVIKDYYPINLGFEIVSPDGKDLIAENGSLYGSDFSVTFKGEEYDAVWEERSREYSPWMYGLRYCNEGEKAMLTFGELSGDEGESDLCLNMPDGSKHEIQIIRVEKKDKMKQTVIVDGKMQPDLSYSHNNVIFTFVYSE